MLATRKQLFRHLNSFLTQQPQSINSSLVFSSLRFIHSSLPHAADAPNSDTKPAGSPKAPAKKGAAPPAEKGPVGPRSVYPVAHIVAFKDDKPPTIRPDSSYPPWIFDRAFANPPSLTTLQSKPMEELTPDEVKRYIKLERRQRIKQKNQESMKDK